MNLSEVELQDEIGRTKPGVPTTMRCERPESVKRTKIKMTNENDYEESNISSKITKIENDNERKEIGNPSTYQFRTPTVKIQMRL